MRAILTRYHGPTDYRGARMVADGGHKLCRIKIAYNHDLDANANHEAAARALLAKMGWSGDIIGGGLETGGMAWVFMPTRAGSNSNRWAIFDSNGLTDNGLWVATVTRPTYHGAPNAQQHRELMARIVSSLNESES